MSKVTKSRLVLMLSLRLLENFWYILVYTNLLFQASDEEKKIYKQLECFCKDDDEASVTNL